MPIKGDAVANDSSNGYPYIRIDALFSLKGRLL